MFQVRGDSPSLSRERNGNGAGWRNLRDTEKESKQNSVTDWEGEVREKECPRRLLGSSVRPGQPGAASMRETTGPRVDVGNRMFSGFRQSSTLQTRNWINMSLESNWSTGTNKINWEGREKQKAKKARTETFKTPSLKTRKKRMTQSRSIRVSREAGRKPRHFGTQQAIEGVF